jgi:hypothetical protein
LTSNLEIGGSRIDWILAEIIAATFSADCRKMKEIEGIHKSGTINKGSENDRFSIVGKALRVAITELSALIRYLEGEIKHGRWLFVTREHRNLMLKWVVEPVQKGGLDLDYVLEVIGRYRRVEGCRRPESTLVDYWMLSPSGRDLIDTIASHALLVQSLKLRPESHGVLEDAITMYRKQRGLEELCPSQELQAESMLCLKETCAWPLSNGYMDLARALRGLYANSQIRDPFGPSRTRLVNARLMNGVNRETSIGM